MAGNDSVLHHNQYSVSPLQSTDWKVGLALVQPLGKYTRIQLFYNWRNEWGSDNRNVYDLTQLSGFNNPDLPNNYKEGYVDSLSYMSDSQILGHEFGIRLNYSCRNWNINAGISFTPQKRNMARDTGLSEIDTTLYYSDISPYLQIGWELKKHHFSLNYNTITIQPLLAQLIPLVNNNDPLSINEGNLNLGKTLVHNINLNLNNTSGFNTSVSFQKKYNDITQMITYDKDTGVRKIKPININGNWNVNTRIEWNKSFDKFSFSLEENGSLNKQVNLVNDQNLYPQKSKTSDMNIFSKIRIAYRPSWGGLEIIGEHGYRHSNNSLQNVDIFTRHYRFTTISYFNISNGLQLNTDISYKYLNGTNIRKDESTELLWNIGITWCLLKKKQLEFSFYWSDILQQQKKYVRDVTANSFYEYRTQQIPGYFILSVRYRI